jgi:hypothetical protein
MPDFKAMNSGKIEVFETQNNFESYLAGSSFGKAAVEASAYARLIYTDNNPLN